MSSAFDARPLGALLGALRASSKSSVAMSFFMRMRGFYTKTCCSTNLMMWLKYVFQSKARLKSDFLGQTMNDTASTWPRRKRS
jgi:hypothetical protein